MGNKPSSVSNGALNSLDAKIYNLRQQLLQRYNINSGRQYTAANKAKIQKNLNIAIGARNTLKKNKGNTRTNFINKGLAAGSKGLQGIASATTQLTVAAEKAAGAAAKAADKAAAATAAGTNTASRNAANGAERAAKEAKKAAEEAQKSGKKALEDIKEHHSTFINAISGKGAPGGFFSPPTRNENNAGRASREAAIEKFRKEIKETMSAAAAAATSAGRAATSGTRKAANGANNAAQSVSRQTRNLAQAGQRVLAQQSNGTRYAPRLFGGPGRFFGSAPKPVQRALAAVEEAKESRSPADAQAAVNALSRAANAPKVENNPAAVAVLSQAASSLQKVKPVIRAMTNAERAAAKRRRNILAGLIENNGFTTTNGKGTRMTMNNI